MLSVQLPVGVAYQQKQVGVACLWNIEDERWLAIPHLNHMCHIAKCVCQLDAKLGNLGWNENNYGRDSKSEMYIPFARTSAYPPGTLNGEQYSHR